MKRVAAIAMAGVMALSLAACGSASSGATQENEGAAKAESTAASAGESAEDAAQQGAEGGRKLSIALDNIGPEENEARKAYFDEKLKAAFPNDEITITVADSAESLQVQVAGGSGPDLFHLNGATDTVEFAKGGRLTDLTPYAEQYGWKDIFYDWAYNTSFYDGKLYSLPNSFEGMVMFYNTDVFEQNGWEKPTNLAELKEVCQKAMDAGIMPIAFGNSGYQAGIEWLYSTFISCYAGPSNMKAALNGELPWTDEAIKGGVQTMVDLWNEGYIGEKKTQALTGDDMVSLFATGEAAMMINGTWASNALLTTYTDCNWDVESMPELAEGVGSVLPLATGGAFAVNASCKDPDFAAEVLNWIFTGNLDSHIAGVENAGMQPFPIKTIDADKFTGMDERMLDMYKALFAGMDSGEVGYCSWTFYPNTVRNYMNENTDALFLGSLTIDDYLAQVQSLDEAAIADGSALKIQ